MRKAKRKLSHDINVVPYLDVMLVLLVILMVSAPLIVQGFTVELPQGNANPVNTGAREPVIVSVDKTGKLRLARGQGDFGEVLKKAALVDAVRAIRAKEPGVEVLVSGASKADYGKVAGALGLLQDAGVQRVGLLTKPLETP